MLSTKTYYRKTIRRIIIHKQFNKLKQILTKIKRILNKKFMGIILKIFKNLQRIQ